MLQRGAEMSPHVAVGIPAGGRRFRTEMDFAAGRQKMAGERSGGGNEQILRRGRIDAGGQLVEEHAGHESAPADELFRHVDGDRLLCHAVVGQLDAQYGSCISVQHGGDVSL